MKDRSTIGQRLTGRHRLLCKMAGDLEGEEILDLGCGFGWFERYAMDRGCQRIVGVDTNPRLIELCRLGLPRAEFLLLDATNVTPDIGTFSVLCMFDFIEHLPSGQDVNLLRRTLDLLSPQGRLLLSVPYLSLLSAALDPAFYFGHRHYSVRRIEELLRSAGFRVRRTYFAGGVWEQISMIWLYIFKWVFKREMPYQDFFERKRTPEYENYRPHPSIRACATMFVEAVPRDSP
ncbi:MAG: class I SAM-dependent methyltransferase [Actinomycetia bacterium]|nr:class I SAM-dependent methyltransferase [Actinomycetes bacterium]